MTKVKDVARLLRNSRTI